MTGRALRSVVPIAAAILVLVPGARAQGVDGGAPDAASSNVAKAPKPLGETLTGEARTSYDIAKILYRDGDYAGALSKFRRAHDLAHDPRLLWNMAACEKNLRRYTRVLDLVDRYLAGGESASIVTDEERNEARVFRAAVRSLVGEVEVRVNEPGADVFVDDELVGRSPLPAPILVDMGARKFRAKKPGFVEKTEPREIEGGQAIELRIDLVAEVHEGRLVVRAMPGDVVSIDRQPRGAGGFDGIIASGPHTIEVSAPGKKKKTLDVTVRDGERNVVEVELEREGIRWPWLVAGGAVIAGALAVGGYFVFRPRDPSATSGSAGTIELR